MNREKTLDAYNSLIAGWYKENASLRAAQIYERLMERGVEISYQSVSTYTREFRKKRQRFYWELDFLAGEEAQVDWFYVNHPVIGKLSGFALILSHSRYLFAHFFPRQSFEFFIEGHLMGFDFFGGFPRALRYDNLKSVVLSRNPLKYNPAFLDFAKYYGFEIRLCNPNSGNEKGRVERAIRTIRQSFLNTQSHHQSLRALNISLHQWVDNKNSRLHRATGQIPAEHRREEKLKQLPQLPWHNATVHPSKLTTKTGMMVFDTNSYSVPEYVSRERLAIHSFCDRIEIYDSKGNKVATHNRCFERYQSILTPYHRTFRKLSDKAKAERIYCVIKGLDPVVERFLHLPHEQDAYYVAYRIFRLLANNSKYTVISAVRDALHNNPTLEYLSFLLHSPDQTPEKELVSPQRKEILDINYKPRSLKDYE